MLVCSNRSRASYEDGSLGPAARQGKKCQLKNGGNDEDEETEAERIKRVIVLVMMRARAVGPPRLALAHAQTWPPERSAWRLLAAQQQGLLWLAVNASSVICHQEL
ncbi:hypothetical protein RRG08_043704 [Elysia crispata]|uniref:Uncharacterized protein n=1 Tax=Elysia crispata TaxID=231223 RepID=A0AAE0ZN32_9GAST|nr:hypothetical protein RRG08_043704 [Elysia crispata]